MLSAPISAFNINIREVIMKFHIFGYRYRFVSPSGFSFANSTEHEIKRSIRVKRTFFPRFVKVK